MPYSNKPTSRIRIINHCLTNKKYWSLEDLINCLAESDIKVSKRTVKGDIHKMRYCRQLNYLAPIEFCKVHNGYHFTDPNYSIDQLPLNRDDIKALELAATTLNQYRYIPFLNEFTSTIDKIIRVVNRVKQENHLSLLEFIEFEKTPVALGLEYMDTIINAILRKTPLTLKYKKFGSVYSEESIIHPYSIKEYRNRWYVVAFNEQKKDIRTYAFDRITELSPLSGIYMINKFIDPKEYFKNCIGVDLKDGRAENVILSFTPYEGMYIKTQKLHRSQNIVQDNAEAFIIELNVVINFELIGIILSYGAWVKVLAPEHLAVKIQNIAKNISSQYD